MIERQSKEDTLRSAFEALNQVSTSPRFFDNYYVERRESPIDSLKNDIINAGDSFQKILFSGHRGSGKTTELQSLKNTLEKDRRLFVTFVAATNDANNLADLVYTDLLFILIVKGIELLSEKRLKIKKNQQRQLKHDLLQLTGELDREVILETEGAFSLNAMVKWFNVFFRKDKTIREKIRLNANSLVHEIIQLFNSIITSIEDSTGRKLVIIVDDLEKIIDEDRMIDILLNRSNVIGALKCHIVLTVPPSLLYSPRLPQVQATYGKTHFLSPFQVHNKDGKVETDQINLMIEMIRRRRVPDNLLNSDRQYFLLCFPCPSDYKAIL